MLQLLSTPRPGRQLDTYKHLSPTSLAPPNVTQKQMDNDRIRDSPFFALVPAEEKEKVKKGITFVYGFMEKNGWIKITTPQGRGMVFRKLDKATKADRVALVKSMTQTENGRRERLLQLASIEGDTDLTQQDGTDTLIKCFLQNLIRFFAMDESFGFQRDMNDVVWSLCEQLSANCFLISACDFVDLQIQKDLQLTDTEKRQRFDKSQVARRVMSAEDLVKYVVENKGNSGLEVIKKLVGPKQAQELQCHPSNSITFNTGSMVEFTLGAWRDSPAGPGFLAFTSKGFKAYGEPSQIPCFDAFDQKPVKFLDLETPAPSEETLLQKQLPAKNPGSRRVSPSGAAQQLFPESPAASSVSSFQESMTLSNSSSLLDIATGSEGGVESSGVSRGLWGFNKAFDTLRGWIGEKQNEDGDGDHYFLAGMPAVPAETGIDRHGGVLLGGFTDTDNKQWFLVLNSWKDMPLFLASGECLAKANTDLAFFQTPLSEFPNGFIRTEKRFTGCASPSVNSEGDWNARDQGTLLDEAFVMGQGQRSAP
ncbi:expressed unknown protein [Seminavis robusta]|uniref:Uncharacterized protein n=1 Tax=Seminavis robusta TaxID=568900 RepID=A0A9N8HJG4_9STRA|nr:expressed unknown protein [Seminavis robusta]|eukprot:Sro764_g199060.1 n/a (536) ;mRNA; r:25126-26733